MKILVTGGAGYIGSHTCALLIENGFSIVVADSLINSSINAINGVKKIAGKDFPFYKTDLRDEASLEKIFAAFEIDCIIHFAGLKAVGESVEKPVMYYENNLISTLNLCKCMKKYGVSKVIFSSSATVYKSDNPMPLTENASLGACNPYGWSKFMCEQILYDASVAEKDFSVVSLRYFNPVGAHPSGLIGEEPNGIPNNLMPFIAQTARGIHSEVKVFGNDYETPDGTGVRDYIHVMDLAKGHQLAIDFAQKNTGFETFNLGTGSGVSVLEMIKAFETANTLKLPYSIAPRRAGDIAISYANPEKAQKILGFKAEKTVEEMCRDTWNFQNITSKTQS
ncbi:MAG: UDP-glucose 4-epimerase GalE [Defluviitaleaceae bacterium]|nr:UDP-glucose 4-epimerase GalE [Defluviitaleaceae bacterium]